MRQLCVYAAAQQFTFLDGDFTPLGGGIVSVINTAALPPTIGFGTTQMRIGHAVGGIAFAELPDHDANVMRDCHRQSVRDCVIPEIVLSK